MQTETSLGTFSFISRWEKSVSGTSLKRKCCWLFFFFFIAYFSEALKWWLLLWSPGSTDAERERSWVVDATVLSASGRRPDPKFREAKRGLAPDLVACWIRPRDCTSKQPVLLTQSTERKLCMHKVALWYECKKPRSNHIRSYFKKC